LASLVYSWAQIPHLLGESQAFGGVQTEATVASAFEYSASKTHIQMPDFLKWASLEPQSVVWLPVLHRFISAQNSQHNVRCICCKQDGFNGFRYRSLKRFNHDLCHQCFLYGRASEQKLVQYPLVEYYNQTGKGENMRDMFRTIRYKMSIKKKKRPVLGYLPINSTDNNTSTHNNTLNTTKSSTRSNQSDNLFIPQSPSANNDVSFNTTMDKTTESEKSKILELSKTIPERGAESSS
jgi:dystrophin